jgi:hypothetical protein
MRRLNASNSPLNGGSRREHTWTENDAHQSHYPNNRDVDDKNDFNIHIYFKNMHEFYSSQRKDAYSELLPTRVSSVIFSLFITIKDNYNTRTHVNQYITLVNDVDMYEYP